MFSLRRSLKFKISRRGDNGQHRGFSKRKFGQKENKKWRKKKEKERKKISIWITLQDMFPREVLGPGVFLRLIFQALIIKTGV